jgi:Pyruvate/2-oxoacid:ferredoxin oxidoreductase gamma subunit
LAHQDTTWAKILEMTNNYIENAETTIVSEEEYKKIKEIMDQLYTIPKSKNRIRKKSVYTTNVPARHETAKS